MKNNLFYNNRVITGGGFAYAVSNVSTTPAAGNVLAAASNYNVFVTPDSTHIGEWGLGNAQDIAQWRTSSSVIT